MRGAPAMGAGPMAVRAGCRAEQQKGAVDGLLSSNSAAEAASGRDDGGVPLRARAWWSAEASRAVRRARSSGTKALEPELYRATAKQASSGDDALRARDCMFWGGGEVWVAGRAQWCGRRGPREFSSRGPPHCATAERVNDMARPPGQSNWRCDLRGIARNGLHPSPHVTLDLPSDPRLERLALSLHRPALGSAGAESSKARQQGALAFSEPPALRRRKKVRGKIAWKVRASDSTKLQVEAGPWAALGRQFGPVFEEAWRGFKRRAS